MHIQPVLCYSLVHVFDGHLKVLRATDTVPYGVCEVGQPSVRAVLGSSKHSQVNNLFGHIGIACYLCCYVRGWVHRVTHQKRLRSYIQILFFVKIILKQLKKLFNQTFKWSECSVRLNIPLLYTLICT